VKEDFNQKYFVKADAPAADVPHLPVLKLNVAASIPTESYTYHYLTSVFVSRTNPAKLVKLTNGSQEWCGNTFKEVRAWLEQPVLVFHSYFDGEGDGSLRLDLREGDLVEDQLPISLRSVSFRAGYHFQTRLLDSLVSNRAQPPQMLNAGISVLGSERIGDWSCWKVSVRREGLQQDYWFDQRYPNTLVKSKASDGRELLLIQASRRKYW
jgi:hypothetical protein